MRTPVDKPTVGIHVSVPESTTGAHWRWSTEVDMIAMEYVYTAQELCSAMLVYGCVVGRMMRGKTFHQAFRLTAHGLITGRILSTYHLIWTPLVGLFLPAAPPTVMWPPPDELPEVVRRGAILHSALPRFSAVG